MNSRSVVATLAAILLSSAAMSVSVISWPSTGFAQDSDTGQVEEQAPRKEKREKKKKQSDEGQAQQTEQAPAVAEEQAPRKEKKKKKEQAAEPEQVEQAPAVAEEQAPRKEKKKKKKEQAAEPEQADQAPATAEEQAPRKEKKKKKEQAAEPEQTEQAPATAEEQAPRKEKRKKKEQAAEPEQNQQTEQAPSTAEEQQAKPDRQKKKGTQEPETAGQDADDGQSKAAVNAIKDRRNASELDDDALRTRFQNARRASKASGLSADQRRELEAMAASDRKELLRRKGEGKKQRAEKRERAEDLSKAEVEKRANELLRQKREAKELDDDALRQRLDQTRTVLGSEDLSKEEQDRLRKRLREDRRVMRERMARRSGESVDIYVDRRDYSEEELNRALRDRRRGDRVREEDLDERIRKMRWALRNERYDREQAEMANEYLREDRRLLRERLHRDRDRRRDRLRAMRDRNELVIEFNPGYIPPPVIEYAESDYADIEMQLVAPPRREFQQRYTVEQIVENDDVREAMPGIDIDTLTFDTGSAEIRPEEIEKLDKVAETIERIVAARPDEVFMVEGHTDAVGSDGSNQVLSEARAQSVMEALTEFYLIEPQNLRTVGLGERFLKIPTPDAEQENRRVTVRRITPLLARDGG